MPRATNAPASRKRRKKWLKQAKGYQGNRSKLYRYAKDAVMKAQSYNYRDRKNRKRVFRQLWNLRINAAARSFDITYSRFIEGLKEANVVINRKILADLAVKDENAFSKLADLAKKALESKLAKAK